MHPLPYLCTHISVYNSIIEDKKLVRNQSIKYFTIAKNDHYPNLDIDTIDHGKKFVPHIILPRYYSRDDEEVLQIMMDRCLSKGERRR
jgi:hypothetical protein